ncbi:MAG TPA: hypothetical protein VMJ10_16355 [Kofleriaceae bacterium]|nr:hypothetical protein [Kofleriaceae bacterium]
MIRGVSIVVILAFALPARADDVVAYEADGDAAAAGDDARTAALDDAFAHAIEAALADLVPGDARTAHKGELDREIIGHARLWVASYSVKRDEVNDDRRQLTVSVRVDRDKLRARLALLHVAVVEPGATDAEPAASGARTIVIFERVASPHGSRADFGDAADPKLAGVPELTTALRAAGYAVRRAASGGPAAHDGDLPLTDEEAITAAATAGADLALVAGVSVGAPTPARGQPGQVALVTARVRLIDRDKVVAQGKATAAAMTRASNDADDGSGYAIARALAGALADVLPPSPRKLAQAGTFQGDDEPVPSDGVVLVRLPAKTPWPLVVAEQKFLAGAKGVHAATVRRLSPRGWVIGVATGESKETVAHLAGKPPAANTNATAKVAGNVVELVLEGTP